MEQDQSTQMRGKSWQDKMGERIFNGDMKKRLVSGAILAPLVLLIIYFGGAIYMAMIAAGIVILSFEWKNIIITENNLVLRSKFEILGVFYILLPATALLWLRSITDGYGITGRGIIFWLMLIVWATDIAGYFAGKRFGGKKLAPKISSNKTWSGFFGALMASLIFSLIITFALRPEHIPAFVLVSIIISIVSQMGDLLESWIKRRFGVKDAGNLIPGHGGLFDRVDGLLAAAVFTGLLLAITGGGGIFR